MVSKITVRSNNGSQLFPHLVREHFDSLGFEREFAQPATAEQNAHIESYHSIVEKELHYVRTGDKPTHVWHG